MLKEFRQFIMRGNVLDLAIAVVIGGAFTAIVNSLVNDIIMPAIGVVTGGIDFTGLVLQVGDAKIAYGNFIQAIVNFLLISLVIFFVVKAVNRLQRQFADPKQPDPAPPPEDIVLLREIRDLLKNKE
jgi:large conductance mechanosensitive channel